jgi:pSer/pThr/pTyr-binding forkhead associated (FHA) protein
MEAVKPAVCQVVVQLLDAAQSGVLKSWTFQEKRTISIGRAGDRDVEIVDAYVSRTHAALELRGEQWVLVSHGRNGVYVDNDAIQEFPIVREVAFRLGPSGPRLVFKTSAPREESRATLCFETLPAALFALDQQRLAADVGAIAGRDEFARLQEQARSLRRRRAES